jgi:predicted amidohydrolase YtcJ
MLDGKTVGGRRTREPEETPSREDALRLYTVGSAWFSFDEMRRGTREPGKLAGFAILNQDFLSVPVDTTAVVRGKTVYAADEFSHVR